MVDSETGFMQMGSELSFPGGSEPATAKTQVLVGESGNAAATVPESTPPITGEGEKSVEQSVEDLTPKGLAQAALNSLLADKSPDKQKEILTALKEVITQQEATPLSASAQQKKDVSLPNTTTQTSEHVKTYLKDEKDLDLIGPKISLEMAAKDACKDKNSPIKDLLELTKSAVAAKDIMTLTLLLDELNERTFLVKNERGTMEPRLDSGYGNMAIDTIREVLGYTEVLLTDTDETKSQGAAMLSRTKEALVKLFEGYPDWSIPPSFIPMLEAYKKAVRVEEGKDDAAAAQETMEKIDQFKSSLQARNPEHYKDPKYIYFGFYSGGNEHALQEIYQLEDFRKKLSKEITPIKPTST